MSIINDEAPTKPSESTIAKTESKISILNWLERIPLSLLGKSEPKKFTVSLPFQRCFPPMGYDFCEGGTVTIEFEVRKDKTDKEKVRATLEILELLSFPSSEMETHRLELIKALKPYAKV